ncbi:MAG: RagB/SusD family nutrient uptake outer membrane protein, partial [Hymenobacter sp.]
AITTKKLIYLSDGNNKANRLRTLKWRTYGQNIPIIRLAEMYLIRAEGAARAGNFTSAAQDVNLVRARSGASALTTVSVNDVLLERQLELAFEGFRVHDLKRTGRPVGTIAASDPRLVLPIPQREINNNSLLTQNAGY